MARLPIIAGNWKMNKTVGEAVELIKQLKISLPGVKGVEVAVAPPFTALYAVHKEIEGSSLRLAAQNLYWEEKGAYTGEISPLMLKELGCQYVIIGHSERRQLFGETDETVNKRIRSALSQDLIPIFCIGETLKDREEGRTFAVAGSQLEGGLKGIEEKEIKELVIAYEPVWAIGTGKTATPAMAANAHRFIRTKVAGKFGAALASAVRILYGGSVKPDNVKNLMAEEEIDGALVGGASLDPASFAAIVRY